MDQFLLQRCQKKRNDSSYDILKERLQLNGEPSRIRLFHYYVELWIHVIDQIRTNFFSNGLEYSFVYLFCLNNFYIKPAGMSQLLKHVRVADLLCAHVTSRTLPRSAQGFTGKSPAMVGGHIPYKQLFMTIEHYQAPDTRPRLPKLL